MARDAEDVVSDAASGISGSDGFPSWIQNSVIGGIILAATYAAIDAIQAAGETFMAPVRAIGMGLSELLQSIILEPTRIIEAGVTTAEQSLLEGVSALLGPFTFPLAVFTVMAGLYVLSETWDRVSLSPLDWLRNLR